MPIRTIFSIAVIVSDAVSFYFSVYPQWVDWLSIYKFDRRDVFAVKQRQPVVYSIIETHDI